MNKESRALVRIRTILLFLLTATYAIGCNTVVVQTALETPEVRLFPSVPISVLAGSSARIEYTITVPSVHDSSILVRAAIDSVGTFFEQKHGASTDVKGSFSVPILLAGSYEIQVYAVGDQSGFGAITRLRVDVVKGNVPEISWISPMESQEFEHGELISVQFRVIDIDQTSPTLDVELYWDDEAIAIWYGNPLNADGDVYAVIETPRTERATSILRARATDNQQQSVESDLSLLTFTDIEPELTILRPLSGSCMSGPLIIEGIVSDDHPLGVSIYGILGNGPVITANTSANSDGYFAISMDPFGLPVGDTSLELIADDGRKQTYLNLSVFHSTEGCQ